MPLTFVKFAGVLDSSPVAISATIRVPAAEPFVTHNSTPLTPLSAVKNTFEPTTVVFDTNESLVPVTISFNKVVPTAVPFETQTSEPVTPSFAVNSNDPLRLNKLCGYDPSPVVVTMSLTSVVPATVPFDRHSSAPLTPSLALK